MLTMRPKRRDHAVDGLPDQEDQGQHGGVDCASRSTLRKSPGGGPPALLMRMSGCGGCGQHGAAPLFGCDVGYDRGDTDAHLALDVVSQRCKCCFATRIDHEIDAFARQRNRDGPAPARVMPYRRSLSCLEFRDP